MFIRKTIIILPLFFIINLFGNTDSASFYLGKGIELYNTGNIEISENYFKKSIEFSKDTKSKDAALIYLGMISIKQGKYNNAIDFLIAADSISNEKVSIYSNLATVYKKKGDYQKSLLYYNKALEDVSSSVNIARLYNNIANLYYQNNEFKNALEYHNKSIKLKLKYNPNSVLYSYLNMASCYNKLNDYLKANYYYQKTIDERIKQFGKNHITLILAYLNYGKFLLHEKPENAKLLFSEAYSIASLAYGNKHPETAKSLASIGDYYLFKEDYRQALEYYQKALIANSKGFNQADSKENPLPGQAISELEQLSFLINKANIFVKFAHANNQPETELQLGLSTYEASINLLFYIQNSFMDESKRQLIARNKDVFYKASEVALKLGNKMKAYELIERSKASTLLAELANQEAIRFGNIPKNLAEKEAELKRMLFYHKAQLNNDTLLYYQQKYDSFVGYLEKNYPKYYNLKYGKKGFNPQNHLGKNQVMLQFAVTDSVITTFVLTCNTINVHKLKTDSVFYGMTDKFLNNLRNYDVSKNYNEQYNEFASSAYYIYTRLIEPIDLEKGKSLIIIPDGIISYIPFEALITKESGDKDNYFSLDYLLYNHPMSYAYSSRWLFDDYLGNSGTEAGAFAMDYRERDSLSAIFHGIPKAKKIKKQFGGKNYFNEECTSSNFIQHAGEYNILFLSLHGIINNKDGMQSYLPLFDRDLYTWELYGMHLNARIAYLSACNTGDGNIDKGEGIMSVARAFAYAGCPTLISSLAAEYDNTPELTELLFTLIRKGKPIDYALQQAKIKHIKGLHMAHPRIWANKIVMGKVTPIKKQPNYLWLLPVGILLFALIYLKVNRYIF